MKISHLLPQEPWWGWKTQNPIHDENPNSHKVDAEGEDRNPNQFDENTKENVKPKPNKFWSKKKGWVGGWGVKKEEEIRSKWGFWK